MYCSVGEIWIEESGIIKVKYITIRNMINGCMYYSTGIRDPPMSCIAFLSWLAFGRQTWAVSYFSPGAKVARAGDSEAPAPAMGWGEKRAGGSVHTEFDLYSFR